MNRAADLPTVAQKLSIGEAHKETVSGVICRANAVANGARQDKLALSWSWVCGEKQCGLHQWLRCRYVRTVKQTSVCGSKSDTETAVLSNLVGGVLMRSGCGRVGEDDVECGVAVGGRK
jgi:hypothetical protein